MRSTLTNIKDMPGEKRSVDTGLGLCNDKSLLLYLHHNSSETSVKEVKLH